MKTDRATLDTNVFEHIFTNINHDNHIDTLLGHLITKQIAICCDDKKRMFGEYLHRLTIIFRSHSDQDNKLTLLRRVLEAKQITCTVDLGSLLGRCLSRIMDDENAERSDQVIVYVACLLDSLCVSNNYLHITDHELQFIECARQHINHDPKFVKSMEACPVVEQW